MAVTIRRPYSIAEFETVFEMRYKMLIEPENMQKGEEMSANLLYEYGGIHLIAYDKKANRIVGTVLGYVEKGVGRLRYLCVLPEYRRRGIGISLVKALEKQMRKSGAHKVYLYAREQYVKFYSDLGYVSQKHFNKEDAIKFLHCPIPHDLMEKPLITPKL